MTTAFGSVLMIAATAAALVPVAIGALLQHHHHTLQRQPVQDR